MDLERRIRGLAVIAYSRYLYRLAQEKVDPLCHSLISRSVLVLPEQNNRAEIRLGKSTRLSRPCTLNLMSSSKRKAFYSTEYRAIKQSRGSVRSIGAASRVVTVRQACSQELCPYPICSWRYYETMRLDCCMVVPGEHTRPDDAAIRPHDAAAYYE